jgi:hypothetical protein
MEKNSPKVEMIPMDKLTGYARNSRTHSDEQIAAFVRARAKRLRTFV